MKIRHPMTLRHPVIYISISVYWSAVSLTHTCTHVWIIMYMYIFSDTLTKTYIHVYIRISVLTYKHMYTCINVYIRTYIHIHRHIYTNVHTYIYTDTYIWVRKYTQCTKTSDFNGGATHTCTHMYTYTCIHIYIYICIFGFTMCVGAISGYFEQIFWVEKYTQCSKQGEAGGWGRDPKKCTGRDWGMGSSTN